MTRTGGSDIGGNGDGGIGGGGTHVVSASLAADVASAASAESAAKLSKLDSSIPGIARSSSVGSVSVDVAVTPSAAMMVVVAMKVAPVPGRMRPGQDREKVVQIATQGFV